MNCLRVTQTGTGPPLSFPSSPSALPAANANGRWQFRGGHPAKDWPDLGPRHRGGAAPSSEHGGAGRSPGLGPAGIVRQGPRGGNG